jgi:hypothetical protein
MSLDLIYVHKGLTKKGFKIDKSGKSDIYCRFYIKEEIMTPVRSKVGGHSRQKYKTLGDSLVNRIYKTLHFESKNQFIDFLECPFSQENYQKMLIMKGHLKID